METVQAFAVFFVILLTGLIFFLSVMLFVERILKKRFSIRSLFRGFVQKMWVTVGLGAFFLGVYLFVIFLGASVKDSEARLNFFFQVYKDPVSFVNLGLFTFAFISVSIYTARLVIKYLYETRRKD